MAAQDKAKRSRAHVRGREERNPAEALDERGRRYGGLLEPHRPEHEG